MLETLKSRSAERIKVSVVGMGRGQSFARGANEIVVMKLVALCDVWEESLREVSHR